MLADKFGSCNLVSVQVAVIGSLQDNHTFVTVTIRHLHVH